MEQVELWCDQARVSPDALRGYRFVWTLSATRSAGFDHWGQRPDTEEALLYAWFLVALLPSAARAQVVRVVDDRRGSGAAGAYITDAIAAVKRQQDQLRRPVATACEGSS
ncbi:hypothetical protein ACU61A_15865 [Pseudonocardia sichuanensis]